MARLGELHLWKGTGFAVGSVLQGFGLMLQAGGRRQYATPLTDGEQIDAVAIEDVDNSQPFTWCRLGEVRLLAADGVAFAERDEITVTAGGSFRIAAPGEWVCGSARSTTSGGTGEHVLAALQLPGYLKE